jgi:hypothetical protein
MVEKGNLRKLAERIKTTKARYSTTFNFRTRVIKESDRLRKRIIHDIIKMLETGDEDKYLGDLRQTTIQLMEKVEKDRKSLNVLVDIIDHPRHIPIIQQYFSQLDARARKNFEVPINKIIYIFAEIKAEIKEKLIPDTNNEKHNLQQFIDTNNFTYLVKYIRFVRTEKRDLDELRSRIEPEINQLRTYWSLVRKMINKGVEFEEEHRKAAAIFIITLNLLCIVVPILPIHAGLFLGIFHMGAHIGEKILQIHDLDVSVDAVLS